MENYWITEPVRRARRIAATITGVIIMPAMVVAADFHWPKFNFDQSPVEPFWSGIGGEVSSELGSLGMILLFAGLIAGVWLYAKALAEVKSGRLIVYRDWKDFFKSSIWIVLIPLGFSWLSEDSLLKILGMASVGYGFYCLWQMISGAFKYNVGQAKWLSLFARFAVTMLLIFSLAKLNEQFENYKRGKYGYKYRYFALMRGVVLPLAIFAWVFRALIQPMVGTAYYRNRRSMESW